MSDDEKWYCDKCLKELHYADYSEDSGWFDCSHCHAQTQGMDDRQHHIAMRRIEMQWQDAKNSGLFK